MEVSLMMLAWRNSGKQWRKLDGNRLLFKLAWANLLKRSGSQILGFRILKGN